MKGAQEYIECSAFESRWLRHFTLTRHVRQDKVACENITVLNEDETSEEFKAHGFTPGAARAINRILSLSWAVNVSAWRQEIEVRIAEGTDEDEADREIIRIIREELFPGVDFSTVSRQLVA